MDGNVTEWARFGIVGLFCCALLSGQIWFLRHIVTTTFPGMMSTFVAQLNFERTAREVQHTDVLTRLDAIRDLILARKEKE